MKSKEILIIGGAGYIGSYTTKRLLQRGYQPIVLDNFSTGSRKTVLNTPLYEGNFGDQKLLDRLFKERSIEAIIHLAGSLNLRESVEQPAHYYKNNVIHTLHLLEKMVAHNVNNIIFSSSAAVYGMPQKTPIPEDHPLEPITPYGKTKKIIESALSDYDTAYGIRHFCFRYFNAAGADPEGQLAYRPPITSFHLIPCALHALKGASSFTLFGTNHPTKDGTCIRDYIHIHDIANALILAMEKLLEGASSALYTLGNGTGFSNREVIDTIEAVTNKKVPYHLGPKRPGDPPILVADATRAQKKLNWHPEFPQLKTMIAHTWQTMVQ